MKKDEGKVVVVSWLAVILMFPVHNVQAGEVPIKGCSALKENDSSIAEAIDMEALSSKDGEKRRLPASSKGREHIVIVPKDAHKVVLEEKERKSRIEEDLVTLRKIVAAVAGLPLRASSDIARTDETKCVVYIQSFKRAEVAVKAYKGNGDLIGNHTLIAGPAENFYISADVPVTNIKQLSYDANTNSVIEKEKPASFYIGFNYKFGDVFTNYPVNEFYHDLSMKFMVRASSTPSESMGLGLGYSFKKVEIFFARVWTKDDASVGGKDLGTTPVTVFGISFNLTKGLNWLKEE